MWSVEQDKTEKSCGVSFMSASNTLCLKRMQYVVKLQDLNKIVMGAEKTAAKRGHPSAFVYQFFVFNFVEVQM